MATKKPDTVRYRVLRDTTVPGAGSDEQGRIVLAGETIDLDEPAAALLIRDGFLAAERSGA